MFVPFGKFQVILDIDSSILQYGKNTKINVADELPGEPATYRRTEMTKLIAPTKLSLPLILVIFTILLLINAIAQADPIKLHPENLYYFLWQGNYKVQGVNTRTEKIDKAENVNHAGGKWTINSPKYTEDVALRILNSQNRRAAVTFIGDFETGDLKGWHTSGNAPKITNSPVRAGKYAMKTSLNRHKDKVAYRTEVSGPGSNVGKEYWYGFSIFLPDDYTVDSIWEIVAQWHGVPDFDKGEDWRNPVMALSTNGGKWGLVTRWDAKVNTFESGKKKYGGTRNYDLGKYRKDKWTDWVVHVNWSYKANGLLEVWRDGKKVVTQKGPNAFNDKKGPYFKMGLYKGWKDPSRDSDKVSTRLLYHDEFRMAGAGGQYEDVAPGCDRK